MKTNLPTGEAGLCAKQGPWPAGEKKTGLKRSLAGLGSLLKGSRKGAASKGASASGKAPQVLEQLARKKFFERLDDRLCPTDSSQTRAWCHGGFEITVRILSEFGFDAEEILHVLEALAAKGSECDCGALFKAAQRSRLKTEYWLARAVSGESFDPHSQMPRS